MAVDVARLGATPGRHVSRCARTVDSPSRIGLDLIAIQRGAPVDLDLRIESVSEGVLVTGTVDAPTSGECARCLTEVRGRVQVYLTELFAYPNSATEATTEEDEVGHVVDETVDLEQSIIDAVGLEVAALAGVPAGMPRPLPTMRYSAGVGARSSARTDRPEVGQAGRNAYAGDRHCAGRVAG